MVTVARLRKGSPVPFGGKPVQVVALTSQQAENPEVFMAEAFGMRCWHRWSLEHSDSVLPSSGGCEFFSRSGNEIRERINRLSERARNQREAGSTAANPAQHTNSLRVAERSL